MTTWKQSSNQGSRTGFAKFTNHRLLTRTTEKGKPAVELGFQVSV